MTKFWVAVVAGVGGVVVGLLIARQYAQTSVAGDVHDILSKVGLGGGVVEQTADNLILPHIG